MHVMMTTETMAATAHDDSDLVIASLSGNRDAFGQIVSRYQSLICSLAYSATGSLGTSEDLAQETFITAWRHLRHLRERHKLKAWLCGIARNRINNTLRREGREPLRGAEPLEVVPDSAATEPLPHDQTISKEEEAILWRSLERIPDTYREPLVLFYREHQSIENVAAALDLTADAVKQRLSRGRKLLAEEVAAFVEGALARTNPGRAFTLGVLAALPLALSSTAKAATLAVAAKGGAKAIGATGLLGVLLSPLLVLLGNYIPYRIGLAEARSEEERRGVKALYRNALIGSLALSFVLLAVLWFTLNENVRARIHLGDAISTWFGGFVVFYLLLIFGSVFAGIRRRRALLRTRLAEEHHGEFPPAAFEYCSKLTLLGLPLLNIRIGDRFDVLRGPVKGWIAVGNCALGGLFAFGGVVAAPICIGGISLGLLSMGGIALGAGVLGGMAAGGYAMGGCAVGWEAIGGCAVAWHSAAGSFAFAHDFAVGYIAHAAQANNETAYRFIADGTFPRMARFVMRHPFWLNLLWIAPLFIQWRLVARRKA
jgi:RNA polymerase sigma factor (sigma-70 family)